MGPDKYYLHTSLSQLRKSKLRKLPNLIRGVASKSDQALLKCRCYLYYSNQHTNLPSAYKGDIMSISQGCLLH